MPTAAVAVNCLATAALAGLAHLALETPAAPATPAGAVMMRSLINWRRDPRYVMNFAVAVLMPFLFVAPALMQGAAMRDMAFLPYVGAAVALSFAMVTMQDTSYDGSALWMHVVSGTRGRDDRLGRFLAVLPVALPLVLVAVLGVVVVAVCLALSPQLFAVCQDTPSPAAARAMER